MNKLINRIGLLLCLVIVSTPVFAQTSRGVKVRVKASDGQEKEINLYKGSYALVIGNSDYKNGWTPLAGVKEDVVAVRKALEKAGFKVETEENLTRDQFKIRMDRFIDDYGSNEPDNRLLIYFAGHGHTMKSVGDSRILGYIVSVDAPDPKDVKGFLREAISMDDILNYAKQIQAKHALFIFDSCFSGKLISRGNAPIPPIIEESVAYPVRQFITAGSANQTVPDESIFRKAFERGLAGEADRNKDGYITGTELGDYLREKVTNYTDRRQTPQYDKINDIALDQGDFVFPLQQNMPQVIAAISAAAANKSVEAQSLTEKALAQLVIGNSEQAKALATQALALDDKIAMAYAIRGRVLTAEQERDKAMPDLRKALQLEPDNGIINAFSGAYGGQDEATKKALQLLNSPKSSIEYFARGLAYIKRGNKRLAIADFNKALELNPRFAMAHYFKGEATHFEQPDQAIAAFTKAIETNPKYALAYFMRAQTYNRQQNFNAALRDYTKAIELKPEITKYYFSRAGIHTAMGRADLAAADLKKSLDLGIRKLNDAVNLDPQSAAAYSERGTFYASYEKYDLALRDYNRAIELDPQNPEFYKSRADLYESTEKKELAEADSKMYSDLQIRKLNAEVKNNPRDPEAYFNRGEFYLDNAERPAAIENFTKAIELNAEYMEAYKNRGQAYNDSENFAAALKDYSKVIELNPQDPVNYYNRGEVYNGAGDKDAAIRDFTKSIELDSQYSNSYLARGKLYSENENPEAAIRDFTKYIEIEPEDCQGYDRRAEVYEALGKKAQAAADKKKSVEVCPQ